MLKLQNVSKYYHSNDVVAMGLRKINLEFNLGEFVAVTGESGSGKSTLLNVISGLDSYEDGEVYVNGEETSYYSIEDWEAYRRQYIGFVFQNYNIIDSYSVLENVMIALKIQGYDKDKRKDRALELIKRVGLESHTHHKASKLSGGQKQRAVIARALAKDCPIIVADEPTGNLDSKSSANIMTLLKEISAEKLVIVVTHNFDEVEEYATRRIRLFDGEVVEDKKTKIAEIVENVTAIPAYKMSFLSLVGMSFRNLFRTPRRSIFTTTVFVFIVAVFTLIYGFFVNVVNDVGQERYNAIFSNVTENRMIVTKFDETVFAESELLQLKAINRVLDVYEHDVVNDLRINSYTYYNDGSYEWVQDRPNYMNPAIVLNPTELVSGRLPESEFEVVIDKNDAYEIGDKIYFGFGYIGFYDESGGTVDYDQMLKDNSTEFTVVGMVTPVRSFSWEGMAYFHEDYLDSTEVISKAYLSGDWSGSPFDVSMHLGELHVMNIGYSEFIINNDVPLNTMNVTQNVIDQLPWLLEEMGTPVDVVADPDFYKALEFTVKSESAFSESEFDVTIGGIYTAEAGKREWDVIELSQATYDNLVSIDVYQVTVYVSEAFDAKLVKAEIEAAGYNAIYPQNVVSPFEYLQQLILSVVFGGLMIILMVIMYFITYFVLKNIQTSKEKDFLIFRSIGASKSSLNRVTIIELMISTVFSYVIVMGLLLLNSKFIVVKQLINVLNYFSFGNYLFLTVVLVLLAYLLGSRFNNRIFNNSVITSLKAE